MGKKCVVWGTRAAGRQLARQAAELGYCVLAFCSSTKESQAKRIDALPVISPEELKCRCLEGEVDCILLGVKTVSYQREIQAVVCHDFPQTIPVISLDRIENEYLIYVKEHLQYKWDVNFENQAKVWLENFAGEVSFWVSQVANPGGRFHAGYLRNLKNEDFLGMLDELRKPSSEMVERLEPDAVVMDIGCGLHTIYGTRLPNNKMIQLIPVDPLAPFYNQINLKCAGGGFRESQFGMFEFIANFFERDYCDAILINNALDHCIDPYKSVIECLYILKKGGTMRLGHGRAEAVNAAYEGLHRWNIDYNGENEFIIWNQENSVNVSRELREIADIKVTYTSDDIPREEQCVIVELIKKKDFQLHDFLDMTKERRQLAFLVEGLMRWIAEHTEAYLSEM